MAIGDGTIIGEEMILSEKIHTATAVAALDTDLMCLSIESYAHMRRIHEHDVSEKLSLLTSLPIFKAYDSIELTPLCDALILKHYIPNKVIVEQGAEPTGMYFIKSGKCKMVKEMDVKLMPPPKTIVQMPPPPPNKKSPQKKISTTSPSVSLPSSSLSSPTSSTKPVPSSSSSSIGPHSTIHPFLASRLDPNYKHNNNNNNNNTLSSSTTTSSSSPSSPPTKSKLSPSTTRKPSSPSKSHSSSPSTEKPETEKKFLEVGPVMPYEYFGERAIIENRSGVEISVLSETHVDLYYLPKIDFHRYINSKTISFMKKNAAGYPSDKEILAQYYKQQEWERYKTNLVQDILNEKANRNMGSMFSRTRPKAIQKKVVVLFVNYV